MSDYLVARLRSTRKWDINAISPVYADMACEAADEIERLYRSMLVEHAQVERLRAALRGVVVELSSTYVGAESRAQAIAEIALETGPSPRTGQGEVNAHE